MARMDHVSESPATAFLRANGVAFTEYPYEYLEHGDARHTAIAGPRRLHGSEDTVMENGKARPLIGLVHGNGEFSTKNPASLSTVHPASSKTRVCPSFWAFRYTLNFGLFH